MAGIEKLKKYDIRFSIVFSIYGDNENDIEKMLILAKEYGASSVKINPIMNIGKAAENFAVDQDNSFLLDMDDIIRLYNRYEGTGRGIQVNMMVPHSLYFLKYISCKNKPSFTGCPQFNLLTVFPDLSVGLCSEARNQNCLLFGRYSERNLDEIWNCSKEIILFRDEIQNNLKGICSKCKARAKCAGGCRALAGIAQRDCYASHPICQYLWESGKFPLALYDDAG